MIYQRLAPDLQICVDILTDPQDYASIDDKQHSTDSIQDGWEECLLDDLFGTADTESTLTLHLIPLLTLQ